MHNNFFARKTKKNVIFFRYSRNYDYFCHVETKIYLKQL